MQPTGSFWTIWGLVWLYLKPLLFTAIFMTYLLSAGSKHFRLVLALVMILLHHGAVVSFFAEPVPRYTDQILLLALTTVCISVYIAWQRLKPVESTYRVSNAKHNNIST